MRLLKALATARVGRVLVLFLSVAASLTGLELALRLLVPAFDPSAQIVFLLDRDGRVHGTPGSGGRQAKNTGDYDVEVRFNRHGLRDSKDVAALAPGDLLVLGDSYSFGWGVEEGERYSDLLAERLGRRVFNAAAPGNVRNYEAALVHVLGIGGRPQEVVVGLCMENDLLVYPDARFEEWPGPWPRRRGGPPPVKAWLSEHLALYLAFTHLVHRVEPLKRVGVRVGVITPNLEGVGRGPEDETAILSTATAVEQLAQGVRLTVLIIPSRSLWVGGWQRQADRVHRQLVGALRTTGLRVVDPRAAMEGSGAPLSFHFEDDGHWNPRGHQLAAEMLAAAIGPRISP